MCTNMRKITSGEHSLFGSMNLRTVAGFPKPQQFQLNTTKEEEEGGWENPTIFQPVEMKRSGPLDSFVRALGQYVLGRYGGNRGLLCYYRLEQCSAFSCLYTSIINNTEITLFFHCFK